MKIFLVSNMYPSIEQPGYGVFVKVIKENLEEYADLSTQALIKGRGKNIVEKILKYIKFYTDILKKGFINDYDIIYTHYGTHSAIPLLILMFFVKKPLVINIHGFDLFVGNSKEAAESKNAHGFLYPFFKKLSKKASLLIVPSNFYKEVIRKEFNLNDDKVFVSPSGGIDLSLFKINDNLSELFENYKIPENKVVISFVSRIIETKGWKILLKSLQEIKKRNIDFACLIVGNGPDDTHLMNMVEELEIEDNIMIFPFMDKQKLVEIYNCSDMLVFPTFSESLGLVALEAMACGTPVIGSNIPPLNEYINDGKNGLLFRVNDYIDLSEKIIYYSKLTNEEKKRYINNCIKTASLYDAEKIGFGLYNRLKSF